MEVSLRSHLSTRLPDYMIPAAIVVLDSMPLTVNGKLDRAALPDPAWRSASYSPPQTALEEELCRIFADVLSLKRVGVDDDFFTLGGHSLMVTRVLTRIKSRLGHDPGYRMMFETPTVRGMATALQRQQQKPATAYARPGTVIRRTGSSARV